MVLARSASLEVSKVTRVVSVKVGLPDSSALGMSARELEGGVMRRARG